MKTESRHLGFVVGACLGGAFEAVSGVLRWLLVPHAGLPAMFLLLALVGAAGWRRLPWLSTPIGVAAVVLVWWGFSMEATSVYSWQIAAGLAALVGAGAMGAETLGRLGRWLWDRSEARLAR